MAGSLIPAAVAMARFFPEESDLYACFRALVRPGEEACVLLIEGDLTLGTEGLLQTDRLFPDLAAAAGDGLVGIVVTGDLRAPRATLLEPDIDWSPRVKILGSLSVRSLGLGGSVFEVVRDLTAESTIFGFYNHGVLRVGGRTRAAVILSSDYTMEFAGKVACPCVLADVHRLSIDAHHEGDALADILDPDLIDSYNSPKETEIIQRLGAGGSILRARGKAAPAVGKAAREKLDAVAARAGAGAPIVEIDLTGSDLRSVPDEIRRYPALRALRLSGNNIRTLPPWIADFAALEVLALEGCGLKALPAPLARHARLRELDVRRNEIRDLPLEDGAFPALEQLRIGGGFDDAHVDFVANLDLAAFPRLRALVQDFNGLPKLAFSASADLWDAPTLEYLALGAVFDERVPKGLARLRELRGLSCSLAISALRSALAVLPRLAKLELLTLSFGSELGAQALARLREALPGVYLRIAYSEPFEADEDDARKTLDRQVFEHLRRKEFAEAAALAERLFELVDLDRPDVSAGWLENAMRNRLAALSGLAHGERDPARRRAALERLLAFAERVLALLPRSPDLAWWADRRDLGRLRLEALLAEADALAGRGGAGRRAAARDLLDLAADEAERHLADHAEWLMEAREGLVRRRTALTEAGEDGPA